MKIEKEPNERKTETKAPSNMLEERSEEELMKAAGGITTIGGDDDERAKALTSCPHCRAKGAENIEIVVARGNYFIFRCKVCGHKYQE